MQCNALASYISILISQQLTFDSKTKALEMPTESEMPPKDKYTVFNRTSRGYRKGIHKVPKFTRVRRAHCGKEWLLIFF